MVIQSRSGVHETGVTRRPRKDNAVSQYAVVGEKGTRASKVLGEKRRLNGDGDGGSRPPKAPDELTAYWRGPWCLGPGK